MKKLLLTLAVALFAICSASANNYVANDAAIDNLVENSVEMVVMADTDGSYSAPAASFGGYSAPAAPAAAAYVSAGKNPVVATLLSWFLGWCGVHRYYLGTAPWMVLPYLLTGGGFGVVYVIDSVLLLVGALDNTIDGKFLNNERILMWADLF